MGKTVQFRFTNSSISTTREQFSSTLTTITPSSSISSSKFCSLLTKNGSDNNNKNTNNDSNESILNYRMINGNSNDNSYSKLPSTSSVTTTTTVIVPVIASISEILTTTITTTTSNYNTIYPSTTLDNQQERQQQQQSTSSTQSNKNYLYNGNANDNEPEEEQEDELIEQNHNSTNNLLSSTHTIDYDSMTEVVIDDLNETEPTSAILDFCKRKFLQLYLNLLGLAGIYPTSSDTSCFKTSLYHLQTMIILTILCIGYYLQYYLSFRRDRGFSVNSSMLMTTIVLNPYYRDALDFGEILFVHIIPNTLHLFGFIFAVYVFRIADNEQLQNLVERVFLLTIQPKRLCIILWLNVICGFFWLTLFTGYVILLIYSQPENLQLGMFHMPGINIHSTSRIALILTTLIQDAIQMTILTAYCIQCYLLRLHLRNLKEKLIQHTIETIDWMREVLEFRKLLNHLNKKISIPVSFFIIMDLTYGFAGLVYVFKEYDFNCSIWIFLLNLGNCILWLIIGMIPFFQAAAVTRSCQSTQASGHQIRVRPFVYHTTPSENLDSTLLFASSLNMSAKLFRIPIKANYLSFTILIISLIILTLGMCLNISLGIM